MEITIKPPGPVLTIKFDDIPRNTAFEYDFSGSKMLALKISSTSFCYLTYAGGAAVWSSVMRDGYKRTITRIFTKMELS